MYLEEFRELATNQDSFTYTVALSREEPVSDDMGGMQWLQGYVHQAYEHTYKDVREDVQFLICGWQNMVDEAEASLKDMGYGAEQIKLELYG